MGESVQKTETLFLQPSSKQWKSVKTFIFVHFDILFMIIHLLNRRKKILFGSLVFFYTNQAFGLFSRPQDTNATAEEAESLICIKKVETT